MITASFEGTDRATIERLKATVLRILSGLRSQMTREMIELRTYIVTTKLEGQVLHHRSGTLIDSVQPVPTTVDGITVTGGVTAAGGPAFYGAYFEEGGKGPYEIVPKTKKALAFFPSDSGGPGVGLAIGGAFASKIQRGIGSAPGPTREAARAAFSNYGGVVVKRVMHPAIPKLPFMAPSIQERKTAILENLRKAAIREGAKI